MSENKKTIGCSIPESLFTLVKRKMFDRKHTWQYVISAAMTDYVNGEWDPDGMVSGDVVYENYRGNDAVLDLDESEKYENPNETIGTRELAHLIYARTGKHVSMELLRHLLRERFPKPEGQYLFQWPSAEDPQVLDIIEACANGALTEIREKRMAEVGKHKTAVRQGRSRKSGKRKKYRRPRAP